MRKEINIEQIDKIILLNKLGMLIFIHASISIDDTGLAYFDVGCI